MAYIIIDIYNKINPGNGRQFMIRMNDQNSDSRITIVK